MKSELIGVGVSEGVLDEIQDGLPIIIFLLNIVFKSFQFQQ